MTLNNGKDGECWIVEPIYARPQLVVNGWQVFELQLEHWPRRTRHFVGYADQALIPYVSAKIVNFDPAQAIGCVGAGRYVLLGGESGAVPPPEFSAWCGKQEASDILGVTAEVVQLMAVPSGSQR